MRNKPQQVRSTLIIYVPACLAVLVLVNAISPFASALVISFEQSEGFPAPILPTPPYPPSDPNGPNTFTGFAGGPNTFGNKPFTTTNGGAVVNWGVENSTQSHGTWYIDDGPGGLDMQSGAVPTCTGPSVNVCDPAPKSGAVMAGFGIGYLGGLNIAYEGVMDLDNSQNIHLDSFWYANRGNGPPRLQVEYYANDANETFLGVNTYALGTDPGDVSAGNGDRWVGVGPNFEPKFQLIKPTAPFKGVALGKVVFRSFADGSFGQNNLANGDVPSATGHGHFFLDDITILGGGTAYNPNNYTRLSFEASEGFPDADGADFTGTSIINVVSGFAIDDNVQSGLQIDHGPSGHGFALPATEPDPIHGSQIALSAPGTSGTHEVTIDLHNPGNYALAGFWYANRGNGPPKLTVQYYDINENLVGENVYLRGTDPANATAGNGDQWVGVAADYNPKFQFIEPSAPFQNVALSKIKLISAPPNPATGGGAFSMDDVLLKPNSGAFNPGNKVRVSFEVSEGFSGTDGDAIEEVDGTNVQALPAGVVDDWVVSGPGDAYFQIDKGPGGAGFGDEDDPVSGNQFALSTNQGNGAHIVTMDLNNSADLALESFYYANRGNFPPQLTVEYFGLNEQSLGTDVYTTGVDGGVGVGLGAGFEPKFQLIQASAQFQNTALSKVVFKSEHSGGTGGAAFAIDDITFHVVGAAVAGDYNGNGVVDGADYVVWRNNKGLMGGATPAQGDGTGDGNVDNADYTYWRARFGNTSGNGSGSLNAVPEPAAGGLALVAVLAVALLGFRRESRRC